jgi:hypothetical protein
VSYLDFDRQMGELRHVMTELEVKKLKEMIATTVRNTPYSFTEVVFFAAGLAKDGRPCSEIIDALARV